ncbi:hypothetical protein BV25DRAFT_1775473, partial [Artomyces pyxidatus]
LYFQPQGIWGLSYDLFTRRIEDNLPNGWGSRRSGVYRRMAAVLTQDQFHRVQYSVWERDAATASVAYDTMLRLRELDPSGIFPTIVKGLTMFSVPNRVIMDVTDEIQLGGVFSPELTGITPANRI